MRSAIQTLTDGLVYCQNFLRDNPDAHDSLKSTKHQQIAEHKKALKILTTEKETSKENLNIPDVSITVCCTNCKFFSSIHDKYCDNCSDFSLFETDC